MPPFPLVRDALLYMVLPAFLMAALVMAAVERWGGAKQAPAGAALGLIAGAVFGLWLRDTGPLFWQDGWQAALARLPDLTLVFSESSWNRLPWAVLAALCAGRVAYLADVHSSDGWLLRGGAALAIAWWVIPEISREKYVWLAPAFALVVWLEWVILDRLAREPGSSSVAVCVMLSLLTAGGVLIHAGTGGLMEASVVLAFALLGVSLIAYWCGVEIGGAIPAIAVALPCLLLMGQLLKDSDLQIHWTAFALPVLAPLTLALTLPFSHWPKLRLHLVRLALVLIPLVIAIVLAREGGTDDNW